MDSKYCIKGSNDIKWALFLKRCCYFYVYGNFIPDLFPSVMEYLNSALEPMSLSLAKMVKKVKLVVNASDMVKV